MKTEIIKKLLTLTVEEKCNVIWLSSDDELYIGFFNTPDNFTGEYKEWYDNGQLFEHSHYENGKLHGEYKQWWRCGQLCIHSHYENGKLHGECKFWDSNGQLLEHELWKNGKKIKDYLKKVK